MGICTSYEAVAVSLTATAKVVLPDGALREYDRPVSVAHVLQKDPACFVCDADVMDFEGFVSAVGADEELRPGNIYFLLPKTMLKHPLHAEDLAALAVRASAALMKSSPTGDRLRRGAVVAPLVFDIGPMDGTTVGSEVPAADGERRQPTKRGRGVGRKFMPDLSVIAE